jgi:hypothetical protein
VFTSAAASEAHAACSGDRRRALTPCSIYRRLILNRLRPCSIYRRLILNRLTTGVGSTLPAVSRALTRNTCLPGLSLL